MWACCDSGVPAVAVLTHPCRPRSTELGRLRGAADVPPSRTGSVQLVLDVSGCGAPTCLDSEEPRWRRYTAKIAMDPTASNSDCQFCRVRFQKSGSPR